MPKPLGGRGKQPPVVDAHGAVALIEYLCNKHKTEYAQGFLLEFHKGWCWVDAEAAPGTTAAASASRNGREGRAHQDAPASCRDEI